MPPKSAKRSEPSIEQEKIISISSDHDYDNGMECSVLHEEEFPPLPVTPSKPPLAKKPAPGRFRSADNIFASDNTAQKLADLINSRSDALEKMIGDIRTDMKAVKEKVAYIEQRVEKNEETTLKCFSRVVGLESYWRRWNLRLHGVPESERENVREDIIDICQQILPTLKEKLPDSIDVAYRLGKKRRDDLKPRVIIIRFISLRHKQELWKAAKNCAFLKAKGLRFAEDLSEEDRENRNKLWPKIKKARDDGKTAYFVGGRGFINGIEIPP